MSREFGSYNNCGYFHTKVESAADDCLREGHFTITRLWGEVLRSMETIAYAISSAEASDSSEGYPIIQSMQDLARVKDALKGVEDYLKPFHRVVDDAIRKHVSELAKETE